METWAIKIKTDTVLYITINVHLFKHLPILLLQTLNQITGNPQKISQRMIAHFILISQTDTTLWSFLSSLHSIWKEFSDCGFAIQGYTVCKIDKDGEYEEGEMRDKEITRSWTLHGRMVMRIPDGVALISLEYSFICDQSFVISHMSRLSKFISWWRFK